MAGIMAALKLRERAKKRHGWGRGYREVGVLGSRNRLRSLRAARVAGGTSQRKKNSLPLQITAAKIQDEKTD